MSAVNIAMDLKVVEYDLVCPVCHLDESDVGDEEIVITQCRHSYCRPCFDKLQVTRSVCPMCRGELREKIDVPPYQAAAKSVNTLDGNLPKLGYDVPYHLIVIEMQIIREHIVLPNPNSKRKPRTMRNDHTIYEFVVYSADNTIVYERHRNVPIGGTEQPPVYILQLLGYAQQVSYESAHYLGKGKDSYLVRARLDTNLKWYNQFQRFTCELPALCWDDYRLMNFVKQEYGREMPQSIHS